MRTTTTVDYGTFIRLAKLDLCAYMDPFLSSDEPNVSKDVLERMLAELQMYDEYHLVYAIELGARHCPELYASHIPAYLAHEHLSVCCAALRILEKMPRKYITQEVVRAVLKARASRPDRQFIDDLIDTLGKPLG